MEAPGRNSSEAETKTPGAGVGRRTLRVHVSRGGHTPLGYCGICSRVASYCDTMASVMALRTWIRNAWADALPH